MASPFIVKASGEKQRFSPKKLRASLEKIGLPRKTAQDTTVQVAQKVKDQMSSRDVFNLAHQNLFKIDRPQAYRYSLKRGIYELGPTGFPFEQIIARLFSQLGYRVKTNVMVPGKCITHEVDAVAEKQDEISWIECKFHNEQGSTNDLKTALYVYARYLDLKEYRNGDHATAMWLASNTRFSTEAITFSNCRGVNLLGWEYPAQGGLNVLLERYQLYPITTVSTLSRKQKVDLIRGDILTTVDFQNNRNRAIKLGIPDRKWVELNKDLDRLHRS